MQNGEAVDFSAFVPVDTIQHEVHVNGTGTGWIVEICDMSHSKAQEWINQRSRERLHKEKLIEQAQVNGRRFVTEERTPDEERLTNVRWLVSRIVGWTPVRLSFLSPDPIPFSNENATRVFMHPKMGAVLSQLIDVLTAEGSFTPRSGKDSNPLPSANLPSPPETTAEQPIERL